MRPGDKRLAVGDRLIDVGAAADLGAKYDGRMPHPGLGQIDELTAKARDAGLDIKLEATSPPAHLPSAVGSAIYRILQESITNVIRHVGPTRVTVALDYGIDDLKVRVINEGRRTRPVVLCA
jgi:hypothetical protein